jgi:hypothetical protein
MSLEIIHDVDEAVCRLLNAPKDIQGGRPASACCGPVEDADKGLQKLFVVYLKGCSFVYPHCERWWKGCVAAAENGGLTREQAVEAAYRSHPAGPAAAPEFVWFIRRFWLRCDRANKKLPLERRVAPEVFLLKWLVDAGERDYVVLASCMPYWPIGLDEHGEWR